MANRKYPWTTIITALVLIVPPALFVSFRYISTQVFTDFPYQYSVSGSDTTYYQVPPFTFIDVEGDSVSDDILQNKIAVVSFFSTGDKLKTKVLNGNLRRVYKNVIDADFITMLSIHYGPDSIQTYVDSMDVEKGKWDFLVGEKQAVTALALDMGFKEFTQLNTSKRPFTAQQVALIDKEGKVRNYYTATDLGEMKTLNEDIRALILLAYPEEIGKD
ncbi:MAG: hypothetical protein AAF824_10010 [Bacteroidota bacterium]